MKSDREERVAPNIYRTPHGWRVYVKRDGVLKPKRFPPDATLEQLQIFVNTFKEESEKLRRAREQATRARGRTFEGDAERYLRLKSVRAMPSYTDRERQIRMWVKLFRRRPRHSITAPEIDEQLQALFDSGYSGSYVNKFRTALMSVWTKLDGRAAANPVKDTREFPEADQEPRGRSYDLLVRILDTISDDRTRPIKGVKGSATRGSKSKARLELMAWTGMAPVQIARLKPEHFSVDEGWYTSPRRLKGKPSRFPAPVIRKPMTADARAAFRRFVALKAWGKFDRRGLRHIWLRAVARVEKQLRKEVGDDKFQLPRVRLYDIRHSFGTELFARTKNLGTVGEMLGISARTARRYALGAVPTVLQDAMADFEKATSRKPPKVES